jgi:hypothetical protein
MTRYNNILLNSPIFFRVFVKPNKGKSIYLPEVSGKKELNSNEIIGHAWRVDKLSINFIIEEILSLGAYKILIDKNGDLRRTSFLNKDINLSEFICGLPDFIRSKVEIVRDELAWKQSNVFLNPIAEELNIKITDSRIIYDNKIPIVSILDFSTLFNNLPIFFLGILYKTQIDIDINRILKSLNGLRSIIKNNETRAKLAILAGLFNSYKQQSISTLIKIPSTNQEFVDQFDEFIENEVYKQLSQEYYQLGFKNRWVHALSRIKHLSQEIIRQPLFSPLFNLGSKLISISGHIPSIEASELTDIIKGGYLPPIISLNSSFKKAKENWMQINSTGKFQENANMPSPEEGWVEVKGDVFFLDNGGIAFVFD